MRDTKSEILKFWFEEVPQYKWFQVDDDLDTEIKSRFVTSYEMAKKGLCSAWSSDADGVLALCLLLDRFPRNMFRGEAKSFDTDDKILMIAKDALNKGYDQILSPHKRKFIYMPFMHSENLEDQKRCITLCEAIKDEDYLAYDYAIKHHDIVKRFGRFPKRNKALGRESTADEICYLKNKVKTNYYT